jgi:short-subunit dehydrogenase
MSSSNSPSSVVFGVGPGLGFSAARFFGQRGYRVALVSRRKDRLREFARKLDAEGVSTSCYTADMSDPESFDAVAAQIREDFLSRDVALYQVGGPAPTAQSPLEITVERERPNVEQLLFGPLHAVGNLLIPMMEQGAGTVLVTLGASALGPTPIMSQYAIPQAGLRNHLLGLAEATSASGVRVRILTIGGLILNSDLQRNLVPGAGIDTPGALDPDALASELGKLMDGITGPETIVGRTQTSKREVQLSWWFERPSERGQQE